MSPDEILSGCFAAVWRLAHALGGSDRVGRKIAQGVVQQSLAAMSTWRAETPPLQWFYHHTVLAARGQQEIAPQPMDDPLVEHINSPDAGYVAFVRAVRLLPQQQREAYLLHHGEGLDDRTLGIAMDCSTTAAQKHLAAASTALSTISQGNSHAMLDTLAAAYQSLTPEQVNIGGQIGAQVARFNMRRALRVAWRLARALILLGIIVGGGWYFRATLMHWYELARSLDQPAQTQPVR